ncbi:MAG: hypothetical protein ACOCWJ_06195, partial [Verrucomicrobiota bacterium]
FYLTSLGIIALFFVKACTEMVQSRCDLLLYLAFGPLVFCLETYGIVSAKPPHSSFAPAWHADRLCLLPALAANGSVCLPIRQSSSRTPPKWRLGRHGQHSF